MNIGDDAVPPSPLHLVSVRDRVTYLRALADFDGVPIRSLATLAQVLEEERLPKGAVLVEAGQPIAHAYFLVEGRVGLYRDGRLIREIVPPHTVSLVGVLAQIDVAPGSIVAQEDCLVLSASARQLKHVWERGFDLLRNSMRMMTREILNARGSLPVHPANQPEIVHVDPPSRPLDFVDRLKWSIEYLPFAIADVDAAGELARRQVERHYRAGDRIWNIGDDSRFSALLISGVIRCSNDNGTVRVGPGYSIGYFDALAERPRGYVTEAETDVVVLILDYATSSEVFADHFELAMRIVTSQARVVVGQLWADAPSESSARSSTGA